MAVLQTGSSGIHHGFERLRERLLDMTLRNPMLNTRHRPTSRRQLQLIDEVPEAVFRLLAGEGTLAIQPLPEPDQHPADETTEAFATALAYAKAIDPAFLAATEAADAGEPAAAEAALAKAEGALRDDVRLQLGLPPVDRSQPVDPARHAQALGIDPSLELPPRSTHARKADTRLQTLKYPKSLDTICDKIRGDARLAEQETGLSTLFLVFGFLEWREQEGGPPLLAPLLLLPVRLDAKRSSLGRIAYELRAVASLPEDNLSLRRRVDKDFGVALPEASADPEGGFSIEAYLEAVQARVTPLKGWRVRRQMTLGHFAFGRLAIYADLDPPRWAIHPADTALVGAVMRGAEDSQDADDRLFEPRDDYLIDDPAVAARAPVLIHDADASQHSALIDAMAGRNLVIQGPPGTGKSQTITNLIANALGAGRTVLFLAEKQAALEVVKRRLDAAGLGAFCLELHSDKASPRHVIEHLRDRLALGVGRPAGRPAAPEAAGLQARDEVSGYAQALHREAADGSTPFGLMWQAIGGSAAAPELLDGFDHIDLPMAQADRLHEVPSARAALSLFADLSGAFEGAHGAADASPWAAVAFGVPVSPGAAGAILNAMRDLRRCAGEGERFLAGSAALGIADLSALPSLAAALAGMSGPAPAPALLEALRVQKPEVVMGVLADLARLSSLDREGAIAPLDEAQMAGVERLAAIFGADARSPRQITSEASHEGQAAAALVAAWEEADPLLQAIGLDENTPAAALACLPAAVRPIAGLPPNVRSWFAWRPEVDVRAVCAAGQELADSEAQWRARYPGGAGADGPAAESASRWPAPDDLRLVAAWLRRGVLMRLVSPSGRRATAAIARQLGRHTLGRVDAAFLQDLASHVERLGAFLADPSVRTALGPHWAGLRSPFEVAGRGQALRNEMLSRLSETGPGGSAVAARMGALDEAGIGRVAALAGGLDGLERSDLAAFAHRTGTLRTLRAALVTRTLDAGRAATADPHGRLADRAEPLAALETAVRQLRERHAIEARLAASPLGRPLSRLDRGEQRPALQHAAGWLHAARADAMPAILREPLLGPTAGHVADDLRATVGEGEAVASRLAEASAHLRAEWGLSGWDGDTPALLRDRLDTLLAQAPALAGFLDLRRQQDALAALDLAPFVARCRAGRLAPARWPALFDGLLARRRAEWLRRRDPVLSQAAGSRIDARRRAFAEADRRKLDADRAIVRDSLLTRRPPPGLNHGPRASWTEGELLRHEMGKQRRLAPVRDLMRRAPRSLQALAPCFMMSPLSLAKFLPGGEVRFDLLIIDEASQMRPEDALGGLLRAEQVVVVGDQKQLPPTDFFHRSGLGDTVEPEAGDASEDLDDESILEACAKAFREARMLKWHYRSRCESLIAFSNREFYGGSLITFPAARPRSFSVDLARVPGRYEARRNPAEAQAVAEDCIAFMRRYADDAVPPSLGAVAVNSDQRDLIEEELRRLGGQDERILRYQEKIEARSEPFFVKNLENVQGDERDYIFVSLTYGPTTPGGPVAQRFGPIAGRHGHRRLNVLFTRARQRLALFASFGSADVRPAETSHEGVRVLKRYLEYAERGFYDEREDQEGVPDSEFEAEVARRLRARGFWVDHQVGVSGFRIDLGIRHPDHPERFIAGLECDGARFHSGKSARDRDRLREDILTGLGWTILRVWSTDWFDDPDLQVDILARRIEALRKQPLPPESGYRPTFAAQPPMCSGGDAAPICETADHDRDAEPEGRDLPLFARPVL